MIGALLMTMTVWYVPGWMRTDEPRAGVMAAMTNAFPGAEIEFKSWDGNHLVWPQAMDAADKESWRLAFEVATMPEERRRNLTIVGHSLGGRITARVLAHLAENGLKVRAAAVLAAAIPSDDPDVAKMGAGAELPVLGLCNPSDNVLRFAYALAGGEGAVAFGANGSLAKLANVEERVVPENVTREVDIEAAWGKVQFVKDVMNHTELFYLAYLRRILEGETEAAAEEPMVHQDFPTVKGRVLDLGVWWDVLDEWQGWKLERNRLTGHARILDPNRVRRAWGRPEAMRQSFDKLNGGRSQ